MSLSSEEKNILTKMKEIRLLENGVDEIELYEKLTREILKFNNIDCIPGLCVSMDDDTNACSAVEGVLEAIIILVEKSGNNKNSAMSKLVEGTKHMKGYADEWASILHLQLLREETLCASYIYYAQNAKKDEKQYIIDILKTIQEEIEPNDIVIDELIKKIEK